MKRLLCSLLPGLMLACPNVRADFDAVVSSPSLWSLVGSNGEVRELWTGPRPAALGPQNVVRLSGYGLLRDGDRWVDLRTLTYSRQGSRPGRLVLTDPKTGLTVRVTAKRAVPNALVFLRYTFDRRRDFRFRVDLAGDLAGANVQHNAAAGATLLHKTPIGPLHIATVPAGKGLALPEAPGSFVRQIEGAREVTVCFHAGDVGAVASGTEPWLAAWLREVGGPEDSAAERHHNRVRIDTGIGDLDRLLDASIDGVEANRFGCGVVIAGADGWYKNAWIRDGTYAIIGHDLAGFHAAAAEFYRFWVRQGGFSWGDENEAQQPAIGIIGMWFHSRLCADGDKFLESMFQYVSRYADYYARRVAREGMIHTAEEWICQVPAQTSWPNAEVCGGLLAAAKIAARLDRPAESARWRQAGQTLRQAILDQAYDPKIERFIPLAGPAGKDYRDPAQPDAHALNGPLRDDRVDSGMLMLARLEIFGHGLGAVPVDDPRFAATEAWIHKVLKQPDQAISRFDAKLDSPHYPTGQWPVWPISSAWAANVEWLRGRTDRAWRHLIAGIVRKRGYDAEQAMYYLPEQWQLDGQPVRTTRYLTWSHGELLTGAMLLLTGFDLDLPEADIGLSPSLPPESQAATVTGFRLRGWSLDLAVSRGDGRLRCELVARRRPDENGPARLRVAVDGRTVPLADGERLAFAGRARGPTARPARSANALERAWCYDRILLGQPLPAELAGASVEALEAHIRQTEDRFDRELLGKERTRRQAEIRARQDP